MPYLGKTPSQATRKRYYKTASGGETSLSGTMTTGGTLTFNDGEFVDVSVNGVALVAGTDYNTTTANTIGGLSALTASDQVEIIVYDTFSVFGGNVDGDFNLNNGTMTLTRDDNSPPLIIKSTDADADVGPEIELFRDSASPANSDVLGQIQFRGNNDAAENLAYAEIDTRISDVADGTEDGELRLQVKRAGTTRTALSLGPTETVFNDAGIDNDFRIESDGNTSMFFLDAGNNVIGIGTGSPTNPLTVRGTAGTGTSAAIRWRDESDQGATLGVLNSGNVALNAEQGDLLLYFGGSSKYNVGSDGNLTINDGNLVIGTAGKGIDFSATTNGGVSTPIELLSDYEEGEWTPTSATNSGTAATFGTATGAYTRVGRLVHVTATIGNIDDSSSTGSSELRVTGLPYTVDGHITYGAVGMDNVTFQGNRTTVVSQANTSEYVRFVTFGGGDSDTGFDYGDTDSTGSDIFFSVSYYTNQ